MRRRIALLAGITLGLLFTSRPAGAVITRLTPLREILAGETFIFRAKVETLDPSRPAAILTVDEDLKGKAPFRKLPVNLTGDSEGQKEKHPAQLVRRLACGLPVLVFTSPDKRGRRYTAFGYTNGTWFQMIGHVDAKDPAAVRWAFTHCEPYLRRTFKASTAELEQVIRDGLGNKKRPPDPDPNEKPGLGPEISPPEKSGRAPAAGPLLAVIPSFALFGPLALLAALFPAVFGGLMLVLKRWMVLLSVASVNSTVYLLHGWFEGSLRESWWGKPLSLWTLMTLVTLAGALWSWRRHRAAPPEARTAAALRARRSEKIVLGLFSLVGLAAAGYGWSEGVLFQAPWKELLVMGGVAWVGALYLAYLGFSANDRPALPAEGVMLWALVLGCAGLGATLVPRAQADAAFVDVAWTFEPEESGTIFSSPLVVGDRIYVAAAHAPKPSQIYGAVYCLDRATHQLVWSFDNDLQMKPVSISSPCLADGRLFIGEGFHEDSYCKLYCLNAADGEKLWEFQTASHVESSPCVAGGKVYFGAGDDGVFCVDAATGKEVWHFPGVHVDTNPAVVGNRLYAGSGFGSYEAFCLDAATGLPRWRTKVDLPVWGSPTVVGGDVLIGLGNGDFKDSTKDAPAGALLCLDTESGAVRWTHRVADAVLMKPAVDEGKGLIFFAARDRHAYGVDREGRLCWKQALGSPIVAAPALAGSRLYVAGSQGAVSCLQADSGAVQWTFDVARHSQKTPQLFSSPAVADGRIYFGAALANAVGNTFPVLYCLEEK